MTTYNEAVAATDKAEYFLYKLEPCRISWIWALAAGKVATYQTSCPFEISTVKEDGSDLTNRSSIALVEANAGSWYWDRKGEVLYVHATGSNDPGNYTISAFASFYHRHGQKRGPYNLRNYEPRAARLHGYRRSLQDVFAGSVATQYGTYEWDNADGRYDSITDWIFEGHSITCEHGFDLIADADYRVIQKGKMGRCGPALKRIKIPINGMDQLFDRNILTHQIAAGANVPAQSVGKWIPRAFGTCYSATPIHTNGSTNEYQINDGPIKDVLAVYENGALTAKTVTKDLFNGKFRLNAAATGTVTCDVEGQMFSGVLLEKGGEIMSWMCQNLAGLSASDIDSTAVAQFDTVRPYELGVYVLGQTKIKTVFEGICTSTFGCYFFSRAGLFTPLAISAAEGSAAVTIFNHESDDETWEMLRNRLPPIVKSVMVYYRKAWSNSDNTRCKVTDASISLDAYPEAQTKEIDTYLRDEADAAAVGALWASYLNGAKALWEFVAKNKALRIELMDTIRVVKERYNIDAYYRVLAIEDNLDDGSATITIIP